MQEGKRERRRRERKNRGQEDDDDGVTLRVVADSRRLRPPRRSHLSLLRLFSRPLFRGVSLSTTRVATNTPSRASSNTHDSSLLSPPTIPPIARATLPSIFLSLSFSPSYGNVPSVLRSKLQQNHLRCTHGRARAIARVAIYIRFAAAAAAAAVSEKCTCR